MPFVVRPHVLLVAWSLLVAVLLLTPGGLEIDGPDWLSELAGAGVDKLAHATLFFVQALCISRAWRGRGDGVWIAAILAAAYGLVLELLQLEIPGRGWETGDAAANALGAFLWPPASRALRRRA